MALGAQAAALLGDTCVAFERLHGGDLSEVVRIRLTSGRTVIAKAGTTARAEAGMLQAIRASGAPAPEVLAADDAILVLEDLGDDEGPGRAWTALGTAVVTLHATTGAGYGWHVDHRFGPVSIPNAGAELWPQFWAERRLLTGLEELPGDLARRIERFCGRLDDHLPRAPRPALLHGDLWAGNVMARAGTVVGLIDPAAYFGHAEVDLAMLCLFAQPGPGFWQSYGTTEPGLDDRRPIYQLWPALVHLRLFGAGYRGLVERLLDRV